jgi:hypothetical protein
MVLIAKRAHRKRFSPRSRFGKWKSYLPGCACGENSNGAAPLYGPVATVPLSRWQVDQKRHAAEVLGIPAFLGVSAVKVVHEQVQRCLRLLQGAGPKLASSPAEQRAGKAVWPSWQRPHRSRHDHPLADQKDVKPSIGQTDGEWRRARTGGPVSALAFALGHRRSTRPSWTDAPAHRRAHLALEDSAGIDTSSSAASATRGGRSLAAARIGRQKSSRSCLTAG